MKDPIKSYKLACNSFIEHVKQDNKVIGITVSGSFIDSVMDKNSDIDVYIILSDDCQFRERGNTWIDGIEIEYFKNPPKQIKHYFEMETKNPHTAFMLAYGKLVYSKSEEVNQLISEAKKIVAEKPTLITTTQIELKKYILDDQFKDIEDSILNDDNFGSMLIRYRIIDFCVDVFCSYHGIWKNKDKRLNRQIQSINSDFFHAVEASFTEYWKDLKNLNQLRVLTEQQLGGRRSKEWRLKSELDF